MWSQEKISLPKTSNPSTFVSFQCFQSNRSLVQGNFWSKSDLSILPGTKATMRSGVHAKTCTGDDSAHIFLVCQTARKAECISPQSFTILNQLLYNPHGYQTPSPIHTHPSKWTPNPRKPKCQAHKSKANSPHRHVPQQPSRGWYDDNSSQRCMCVERCLCACTHMHTKCFYGKKKVVINHTRILSKHH